MDSVSVILGKVRLTWKEEYDAETGYSQFDVVSYAGSTYICTSTETVTGTAPTTGGNNAVWDLFISGVPTLTQTGSLITQDDDGPAELEPGTEGTVLTSQGPGKPLKYMPVVPSQTPVRLPDCPARGGMWIGGGAVLANGALMAWGDNGSYQLGNGLTTDRTVPQLIPINKPDVELVRWRRVANTNVTLWADGEVWAWGVNTTGCLGNGTTTTLTVPTKIDFFDDKGIVDIFLGEDLWASAANSLLCLSESGLIYTCGSNGYGVLGLGDTTDRTTPETLAKTDWQSLVMGGGAHGSVLAIDSNKDLWTWGNERSGALGIGASAATTSPTKVSMPGTVGAVAATFDGDTATAPVADGHTLILLEDGSVYSCGYNEFGQLGIGSSGTTANSTPQEIDSLGTDNAAVYTFGGKIGSSLVLKNDGTIRVFGYNGYGQLGTGDTNPVSSPIEPTEVSDHGQVTKVVPLGSKGYISLALLFADGSVMTSGYNGYGALGLGDTTNRTAFEVVPLPFVVEDIAVQGYANTGAFQILSTTGQLFHAGYATQGSNGDPVTANCYTPQLIRF